MVYKVGHGFYDKMLSSLGVVVILFLTLRNSVLMQVYNDADILEKILKDKRKELGPPPEEEDLGSPRVKLSMMSCIHVLGNLLKIS